MESPAGGNLSCNEDRYNDLDWIKVNEILARDNNETSFKSKIIRKTKENPFVPIGILATTVALTLGLWSMQSGNSRRSQLMMRARIMAQGFTVGAIIVGMLVASTASKPKEDNEGT